MPTFPSFRSLGVTIVALGALLCAAVLASCLSSNGSNPILGNPEAGTGDAGAPVVSVNGTVQDFGTISLGQNSGPTSIIITNTGTAATGVLSTSLGGTSPIAFHIDSDACNLQVLPGGGSCTVSLHFVATAPGVQSATFTITATPGGTVTVKLSGQAAAPGALSIAPASNDYGPVVVGMASAATTFTVTNTGGLPTGTLAATLQGTDLAQFAAANDGCTGQTLAAGATCSVDVSFAPNAVGTKVASLSVVATPGGSANAALSGTAITGGALSISPATQDFLSWVVGATSTSHTFTVTNTGGATTGATFAQGFTGTNATEFAVAGTTCNAALAPGKSCTYALTFAPQSAGPKTATFTVGANPGGTAASTVTGTGLSKAALAMTPAGTLDFGSVVVGQQSNDTTFTVTNTGGAASGALQINIGTKDFFLDAAKTTCTATPLAPKASCALAVYFKPSSATSPLTGAISVTANPGGTQSTSLTGTGLTAGALALAPANFTFVPTLIGQTTADQTFTVSNTGGGSTGTLSVSITGTGKTEFKLGTDGCSTKSLTGVGTPGAKCTFNAHFAPTARGNPSATLLVTAAGAGGSVSASVNGTGQQQATLAGAAPSYNVGTAATGSFTTTTLVLDNTGDIASGTPAFASSGTANAPDFTAVLAAGMCAGGVVPARSSCNVTVTFAPKTTSGESATLTATGNPGGSAPTTLNGTGAVPAAFTFTPASHPFGPVVVNTVGPTQQFTIKNVGGVPAGNMTALVIANVGGNKGDFVLSGNTCPAVLNAGGTCLVSATYQPTTTGPESTSLTVTATPGVTSSAALTGTGLSTGQLVTDTSSFPFGTFAIGTPSPDKIITISNTGGGPTSALGASINGGAGSPFKIDAANTTCSGAILSGTGTAGSTCTVAVFYVASASGPQSDTLTVSAATGGTVTTTLQGVGQTPAALALTSAQGSTVTFGGYVDGTPSPPVTLTITNTGEQASGPISINPANGPYMKDFQVQSAPACLAAGLAGGGSCQISIVFIPSAVGPESSSDTASATPGGTSAAITFNGVGYSVGPELQITPLSANLGNVLFVASPGTAAVQLFTVTNVGGTATGTVTASLTGAAAFSITTYPGSDFCSTRTLAANGGACTIGVAYNSPTVGTISNANLSVTEPNGASDTLNAPLSATSTANGAPLSVTEAGGMGGSCSPNDAGIIVSSISTFTIQNLGAGATGAISIAIAADDRGQFVIVPGSDQCSGVSLLQNGSCTFQMQFQTTFCPTTYSLMTITDTNGGQLTVGISASMG